MRRGRRLAHGCPDAGGRHDGCVCAGDPDGHERLPSSTTVYMESMSRPLKKTFLKARRLLQLIRSVQTRPDFRRNPLKALGRRLVWRIRWKVSRKPWVLSHRGGVRIAVGKDGQGSLLYYQGFSEPEVEDTVARFLKAGMTFVDVGAHVGKYALLAAQAVGDSGEVYAFEPNPAVFKLLLLNIGLNGFSNVHAYPWAVADACCPRDFDVRAEATVSSLAIGEGGTEGRALVKRIRVDTVRLDDVCGIAAKRVDLVKVDVEGAELMVFSGAARLLQREAGDAPVWIFEYEPLNYAQFGYGPADVARFLLRYDYETWLPQVGGRAVKIDSFDVPQGVHGLLAAKKGTCLSSIS